MKKLVLFFIVFVSFSLSVVAQRFQSDHYFIEAEEALENDDYQKALDNVNMFIDDYPKLSDGYMLRGIINYYRKKMVMHCRILMLLLCYGKKIVDIIKRHPIFGVPMCIRL